MSLQRFYARVDAKDGVIFTGHSNDPVDAGTDNFEPGLLMMVDVAQSDDVLDRD